MSIIGLLDWDLTRWRHPTVFSLELMKLAHYYKVYEKDIVKMMYGYDKPEAYSKIIISKDYEDYLYPKLIMENPDVEYRGLALSTHYVPMDDLIENRPADTSIYSGMKKYYKRTGQNQAVFKRMIEGCHLRISLDGETINKDWSKQLLVSENRVRNVILHDKDAAHIKDSLDLLQDVCLHYGRRNVRLGTKFPLIVRTDEELLTWGRIYKAPELNNMYLEDIMSNETMYALTDYKQQLTYLINNRYWTIEKFINGLPKIFLQGIFLSQYSIPILLKIDKDFLVDEEWHRFVDFLNSYFRIRIIYRNSLVFGAHAYCKHCYNALQREEKIKMFQFIRDNQPILFDFLYDVEEAHYNNGELTPELFSWEEIEKRGGYGGYEYRKKRLLQEEAERNVLNYEDFILPEYLYLE